MKKRNGYVVFSHKSGPLQLGTDNVLWITSTRVRQATLFPSLRAARQAIARSTTYDREHGLGWPCDYEVCRVSLF